MIFKGLTDFMATHVVLARGYRLFIIAFIGLVGLLLMKLDVFEHFTMQSLTMDRPPMHGQPAGAIACSMTAGAHAATFKTSAYSINRPIVWVTEVGIHVGLRRSCVVCSCAHSAKYIKILY